jgi:very-short-patch-repair endonuclease
MTPQEVKLWAHLRSLKEEQGWKFRRQAPLRGYIVDFACFKARMIIEVDGSQHGIGDHVERDHERDATLERNGFSVLRFWNVEIDREFDGVWRTILDALLNAKLRDRWDEDPPRP